MKRQTKTNPREAHLIETKRRLLAAALEHVVFDGWSAALLARAAKDSGIAADEALRAFPGGAIEMVEFWIRETDQMMLEKLARIDLARLKIRERIARAVLARLEPLPPHREALRRALALLALPQNAPKGLASLYRTVDAIWNAAGDTSTDWNFYSKRFLLAGVYSSTLLFWLEDRSEGFCDTRAFLDRRIDDVMQIQKLRGWFDRLGEGVSKGLGKVRAGGRASGR